MNQEPNQPYNNQQPPSGQNWPQQGQEPYDYGQPSQPLPPHTQWGQQPYPPQQSQWQQPYGQSPPQQYPPMYPPPPPKKSHKGLWIALGVVVGLIVFACIGVSVIASQAIRSNTDVATTPLATQLPTSTFTPTPAPPRHFKQTEAVEVNGLWNIEIVSVKTSTGSQYNTPQKAGDVFLIFLVKVKNISNQEQNISSIGQFTLLDSTGQKYDETFDSDAPASLDGKVEPNSLLQGSIVFEVPASMKTFTFSFEPQMFAPGEVIWDVRV